MTKIDTFCNQIDVLLFLLDLAFAAKKKGEKNQIVIIAILYFTFTKRLYFNIHNFFWNVYYKLWVWFFSRDKAFLIGNKKHN